MNLSQMNQKNDSIGRKVLIVDDNEDFVKTWTEVLNNEGYMVIGETLPLNVEKLVKKEFFDVMLLDLIMPLYSGLDVLIDVMSQSLNHRVIIISGENQDTGEVVECLHRGASDYINKGFKKDELIGRIATTLKGPKRFNPIAVREHLIKKCLWPQVQLEKQYKNLSSKKQIKGKRLEQLFKLIFESVPQFKNIRTNIKGGSEEIDLEVENKGSDNFWNKCGTFIFIECKNWSKEKVPGRVEYDSFVRKLGRRPGFCKLGFFISMNGFSKDFGWETRITREQGDFLVIPLFPAEIELLVKAQSGNDREKILKEKIHNVLLT